MEYLAPISLVLWIIGLVCLLRRRDIDIHDKLTWVVLVLLLNGLGALLYFIFGPRHAKSADHPDSILDQNARPVTTDSEWDPIRGEMWKPRSAADDEIPEIDDEKTV